MDPPRSVQQSLYLAVPTMQEASRLKASDSHQGFNKDVEDKKMASKLESLKEQVWSIQGIEAYGSTNFSDLCFFPDLKLPPKYMRPQEGGVKEDADWLHNSWNQENGLSVEPCQKECKKRYPGGTAMEKADLLCSKWQEYVQDSIIQSH
ncbi:hypothetical protein F0562_030328 [Nyssa sinensis]|uniref:Uncharacterized protein n=1 Tax=Nyssa sinensis TaxID=561372 RepID=A0A5J5AW42_9ASTE|nr:hypothetical protein F0562_030328 [Nyssa sinensis]